jgi:hypothetical protein
MMASSTITQIQVFYNSTTSAGYWRADNVNSFFVTNAAGTLQNFAVADTGACTLGNTSATGPSGGHHVFRTGYSGVSTSMYSNGEIHFGNSDSGGTIPTIAGTTTTANNVGLYLSAAANNSNTASDMNFDVRESDVANGSDFATLTNKAFRWTRYGNELASMTREGVCTFGDTANTAFKGNKIVGRKDGTTVPVGYVGEKILPGSDPGNTNWGTTGTTVNIRQLALPAGVWLVFAKATARFGTALVPGNTGYISASISTVGTSGFDDGYSFSTSPIMEVTAPNNGPDCTLIIKPEVIASTGSTTVYLNAQAAFTSQTGAIWMGALRSNIEAIRIG